MLVYGDHSRRVSPRDRLLDLERERSSLASMPAGLERHSALVGIFIELAGIVQGVADARFAEKGRDAIWPEERQLMRELVDLAEALLLSWDGGFPAVSPIVTPAGLPRKVEVRLPEGYAFYALYPEAYALAARQLKLSGPAKVIGLRSIGTGLAAIAAATLWAPPPITLRPIGHPFDRRLSLSDAVAAELLDEHSHYVIVDEGPGLSGSSFGAVADWLEGHGIASDRIAFLPGHAGDLGPHASERHRQRWSSAQRPVADASSDLPAWIEGVLGRLDGPLIDISGGGWRSLWNASEAVWPAVNPTWERRKFVAHHAGSTWLVKFAGLGRVGHDKLALARHLHSAGFGTESRGLAHGWLVQRWYDDAVPTRPTIDELARYLRLRSFLPADQQGATLSDLLAMAQHNAPALRGWQIDISALQSRVRPVRIDGRMAAHEWLRLPSGQLLKADAVDHHAGHDLIGCQDIAWDLAGAAVELDLTEQDVTSLQRRLGIDPDLLAFSLPVYTAFRIGSHRMSESMLSHWPEEQARHRAAAEALETRLLPAVDAVQHLAHVA